jgi:Bacterial Ig-like domain (group 3)
VQAVPPATGTPQGTIDLSLDGQPRGSAALDADGSATFTIEVGQAGSYVLEAQYQGDDDFAPSGSQSVFAAGAAPDPGGNVPGRPQLPRAVGRSSDAPEPAPRAPSPEPTAERPSEMAFTGAFTLPGLLLGLSSIGLGLGCRRFARRPR